MDSHSLEAWMFVAALSLNHSAVGRLEKLNFFGGFCGFVCNMLMSFLPNCNNVQM
jgi:hypothetical protein